MVNALTTETSWQAEADRRWPDGMDMADWPYGDGRYATLSWCGPLTVHLHQAPEQAEQALRGIVNGCGHDCWGDHEIVDLGEPEAIDPEAEYRRGPRRAAHAEVCDICRYVYRGKVPRAAMRRAANRRRRAA